MQGLKGRGPDVPKIDVLLLQNLCSTSTSEVTAFNMIDYATWTVHG